MLHALHPDADFFLFLEPGAAEEMFHQKSGNRSDECNCEEDLQGQHYFS